MQVNLTIIALVVIVSSFTVNAYNEPVAEGRDVSLATCEKLYGLMAYPRKVQNITVLRTSPLRVRVYFLAVGPTRSIPFSVEGMVCQHGFDQRAANAACRSQSFNNAVLVSNVEWHEVAGTTPSCIMDTDTYKSPIPCEYILNQVICSPSATNLAQCTFPTPYTQLTGCNPYTHVGLICT